MIYYVDGFMHSGNPCLSGGCTVVDEHNNLLVRRIFKVEPPKKWTNNDAELWAVACGVAIAGYQDTIYSDSEVMVKWWLPRRSAKTRKDLNPLIVYTANQIREKDISLLWVGRDDNLAGIYNDQNRPALWSNLVPTI